MGGAIRAIAGKRHSLRICSLNRTREYIFISYSMKIFLNRGLKGIIDSIKSNVDTLMTLNRKNTIIIYK